jgi:xylulokinase
VLGAALLGATAGGIFGNIREACRAAAARGEPFMPDAANTAAYREAYRLFTSLYPALRGVWGSAAPADD